MTYPRKLAISHIAALVICLFAFVPRQADAITPVFDAANSIHFLTQINNQIQQINNQVQTISLMKQNISALSGPWTNVQGRLVNLQSLVGTARQTNTISGAVADAQLSQLGKEISLISNVLTMGSAAKGTVGSLGVANRLNGELVSQLEEQRQLTIAQIKQTQVDEQQAMDFYHQHGQDPSTY